MSTERWLSNLPKGTETSFQQKSIFRVYYGPPQATKACSAQKLMDAGMIGAYTCDPVMIDDETMRKWRDDPETHAKEIAQTLEQMNAEKNQGRGLECIRSVITWLRRGMIEHAKNTASIDSDKLHIVAENVRSFYSRLRWI